MAIKKKVSKKKAVKKDVRKKTPKKNLTKDEKEEKKREGELPPKKVRSREEKQIMWFLFVIALGFVVFLATFYGVQSQKYFKFGGAEWWIEGEKEGWGDLTLYHGRYPVKTTTGKVITNMNIWLRNDPRENDVESDVNFTKSGIAKNVIISFDNNLLECQRRSLIVPQLSQVFGSGLPWTTTSGAVSNKTMAEERNLDYANCSNVNPSNTVILIEKGNQSRVYDKNGCYMVEYANCDEVLEVSDKLILELIRQLND